MILSWTDPGSHPEVNRSDCHHASAGFPGCTDGHSAAGLLAVSSVNIIRTMLSSGVHAACQPYLAPHLMQHCADIARAAAVELSSYLVLPHDATPVACLQSGLSGPLPTCDKWQGMVHQMGLNVPQDGRRPITATRR